LHVTLQSFFERFPAAELGIPAADVPWRTSTAVWGLEALPVTLT
jgi:cytochrome P450